MRCSARIALLCLAVTALPRCAHSQGPIAPPHSESNSDRNYQNSMDGLRWQLQDILNAARGNDRVRLEALIQQTEISDYVTWFTRAFGQETGQTWATAYGTHLSESEQDLADVMASLAGEDGEFFVRSVNYEPAPAREIEATIIGALQKPIDIFFASWKERGAAGDSKSAAIGYFVFINGRFRWDSAIAPTVGQSFLEPELAASEAGSRGDAAVDPARPSIAGGQGAFKAGADGVGYPHCDYCPIPQYTRRARRNRLEGTVKLQMIVELDGSVTNIQILSSPDAELSDAVVAGVSRWHLRPARFSDGEAVRAIALAQFNFRLIR